MLLPLIRFRDAFGRRGIDIDFHTTDSDRLTNCDVLLVEDLFFIDEERIHPELTAVQKERISQVRRGVEKLLWFDTSDSTRITLPSVLPHVDTYCKKQLLVDRELYTQPLYASRLYSDYYLRNREKFDLGEQFTEEKEVQLSSAAKLSKLSVAWNLGFDICSPVPDKIWVIIDRVPYKMSGKLPWNTLIQSTGLWTPVDRPRPINVSGRFSTGFALDSVEFHRKLLDERLQTRFDSDMVNPITYWKELKETKLLLSPFGHGEVCFRDFEGFMNGCVVVKPEIDHIETWPPVYEAGETIVTTSWGMEGVENLIDKLVNNYDKFVSIAERGQKRYRKYISSGQSAKLFVDQFLELL